MPPPQDQHSAALLARLNALRPTPVSLGPTSSPFLPSSRSSTSPSRLVSQAAEEVKREQDLDISLTARFAKLGVGAGRSSLGSQAADSTAPGVDEKAELGWAGTRDMAHNEEDDKTLDELLGELGADPAAWTLEDGEQQDVNSLIKEAQEALRFTAWERAAHSGHEVESKQTGEDTAAKNGAEDGKEPAPNTGPEPELPRRKSEDEEVENYMKQALAAADFERRNPEDDTPSPASSRAEDDEDGTGFSLPSAPTDLPSSPVPTTPMSFLPATPTSLPSSAREATTPSNLPTYTDDDIDSWCIICNDDATLKCLGCDGDLYCANCWKEGHVGEDAGYEEKMHRAVEFVKGQKKQKRRRKVGAS